MEAVTTQLSRDTMFSIGGWRYPRHATIEADGTIRIEIARAACRHCPTCAARVNEVLYRLRGRDGWGWAQRGSGLYLVIKNNNGTEQSTAEFLSAVLDTNVTEARR